MTSTIAWLDASSAEQRQMRDIIRLFADRDARDELGLGQVRDALGDILFPGTSTLHSRARYLLFVPWIYRAAADRKKGVTWADAQERLLIKGLKDSDDFAGVLGMRAGSTLKTLPSSIYWAALGTYGIRTDATMTRELALEAHQNDLLREGGDARARSVWSPTLPEAPAGFPREVPNGLSLTHNEAEWLRERLLSAAPESLFAHLLEHPPDPGSEQAWLDPSALLATGYARRWLDDAHRFSTIMHGAQLLYNLLLAETHGAHGYAEDDRFIRRYRDRIVEWQKRLSSIDLSDPESFETLLLRVETGRGAPLHPPSRRFIRDWYAMVRALDDADIASSADARAFIARRERAHKGGLSRLKNPKRLQKWGGASGAAPLTYRWTYVQRTIGDIFDGLERTGGANNA